RFHTSGNGTFGNSFTDQHSCFGIAAFATEIFLGRRCAGKGLACQIVDDLCIDMRVGTVHAEARATGRFLADRKTNAAFAALEEVSRVFHRASPYFFLPSLRKIYSPS